MNIEEELIQNWIHGIAMESLTILDEDDDMSIHVHNRLANNLKKIEILSRTC